MSREWVAALAVCCLAAAPSGAESIDREFHESFEVAAGDSLELRFGDGDVEVTAWEQDLVDVHVRYRAEQTAIGLSAGGKQEFWVEFERSGDVVRVVGHEPRGPLGIGIFTRRQEEYRYTVRAPSYLELQLRGDDGDVRIRDWNARIGLISEDGDLDLGASVGELRLLLDDGDALIVDHRGAMDLRLEDGDVEIAGCESPRVSIETEDGDVEVERCRADLDISTEDGHVYVDRVEARSIDVRTGDGDAILALEGEGALDLLVRTGDGDVELDLGPLVSARFTIDTAEGPIRIEGPEHELSRDRTYASGTLGAGEGTIRVLTGDGRVTLRQRIRAESPPAERPDQ